LLDSFAQVVVRVRHAQPNRTFTPSRSTPGLNGYGKFNGHDLLVAKALGEFVWHKHDETDDFFLVLKGTLVIEMRDRNVTLRADELFVVPKGVEHRPVAHEEVHVLVIEPLGTPNTGDATTASPPRAI